MSADLRPNINQLFCIDKKNLKWGRGGGAKIFLSEITFDKNSNNVCFAVLDTRQVKRMHDVIYVICMRVCKL